MTLHDAYARLTPFEVAFPDDEAFRKLSAEILTEASAREIDASDPEAFLAIEAVARAVRGLRPPDDSPEAVPRFGALLFHAVHFLEAGRPLYLIETPVSRRLVTEAPSAPADPPSAAGYVQLPQHLFWVGAAGESAPESVDGAFWTAAEGGLLHVLLVSGLRPDRPGFGVYPLPAAPLADAANWLDAEVRESGPDYASSLEGADLDELYSIEAAGEALKLLARFFAHTSPPGRAFKARQPAGVPGDGPSPSGLPYARVEVVP